MINNKIMVTGSAGFIGYHLCKSLLRDNFDVLGIDNINNYYDVNLKNMRLKDLKNYKNFSFEKIDITNRISLSKYWDFENNVSSNILSLNEQDIEKETFNLTKKIIQDHLISDVPVGLCLSSGSDSQLLLNFIKNENLKKIECFTFGFDEEKYDEIRKLKSNNLDSDIIFNSIILKQKNGSQQLIDSKMW